MKSSQFKIDPEFEALLPSVMTDDDLKADLIRDGEFQDAVTVWREKKILLDGHRRTRLHQEATTAGHAVKPLQVKYRSFASRSEAAWWAMRFQSNRRNLSPAAYALAIVKNRKLLGEVTEAAAKRRSGGKLVERAKQGRTNELLAAKSGGKTSEYAITVVKRAMELQDKGSPKLKGNVAELMRRLEQDELSLREFNDLTEKLARYEQSNERASRAKEIKLPPVPEGKVLDTLLCMDVLDGLARVKDESVDLTVTSPPYPLADVVYPNYCYDGDYEKYLVWLEQVFRLVYQKTKDGGECAINCVECSDQTGRSRTASVRPLLYVPGDVDRFMRRIGWALKDTILWYKQKFNGTRPAAGSLTASNPRYQRSWEYLLVFQKGTSGTTGDINLEDLTRAEFSQWQDGHWVITPETKKASGHRCPFPAEIPRRVVKRHTRRGDVVLDCFMGTGTTCWVAKGLGRRYIGIDNDPAAVEQAIQRFTTSYVEPKTEDKLDALDPKQRIDKLISFRSRQKGRDEVDRLKTDAA